jgi:transcription initiation factor TFIIE subunit alpha
MVKKKSKKPSKKKKVVAIEKPVPKKFPEDMVLQDLLYQTAGAQGTTVVKAIFDKELTDEDVAKKTGISLNLVRRILYELYDNRVVSYRRTRDENSGWYIYFWKMEPERAIDHLKDNQRLLLQKLEERLEEERNTMYFVCNSNDPKVSFDAAVEAEFKCPKCGGKLKPYNNSATVVSLERRVESLKQQLIKPNA